MQSEFRSNLESQKRMLQITLIKEKHPVYIDFDFAQYSDVKIAEMYRVLVLNGDQSTKETETQT